ncbi:hypothetical protein HDU83_005151 [Entophlyctis luteolus]|nr:hypothetical protein HDU83_005151 [Entophlyctis luteolus]
MRVSVLLALATYALAATTTTKTKTTTTTANASQTSTTTKTSKTTKVAGSTVLATTVAGAAAATGTTVPTASPYHPGAGSVAKPAVVARTKTCTVTATGGDDGPAIKAAAQSCNGGGKVILAGSYSIQSFTDLRGISHVDYVLTGTITMGNTKAYWLSNMLLYTYQSAATQWVFGGTDINIYGGGTIDGNGSIWPSSGIRPVLLTLDGVNGGAVWDIKLNNAGFWNNLCANSTNVIYDNIQISATNKNTDGWDTYKSDNVVIQNSVINNGDDCVSFKPNSTNMVVQGLSCTGSHGVSVGSLGQYSDQYDIVKNIYVYNVQMNNAENGARIKVWPGATGGYGTGGGSGHVQNITYDTFTVSNVASKKDIVLTQCYNESDLTACNSNPSKLTIQDVYFKNFYGSASKPSIGTLECSLSTVCSNINTANILIAAGGSLTADCHNMDETLLQDITCTDV